MSSLDYLPLNGGPCERPVPFAIQKTFGFASMILVVLARFTIQFARGKAANAPPRIGLPPFYPSKGIKLVMVRPGPPGLLQSGPAALRAMPDPSCLFVYGALGEHFTDSAELMQGATAWIGWIYGARLNEVPLFPEDLKDSPNFPEHLAQLAKATGFPADVVNGTLLCWSRQLIWEKLQAADELHHFNLTGSGNELGVLKRRVASVVCHDGSVVEAYWYYLDLLSARQSAELLRNGGAGNKPFLCRKEDCKESFSTLGNLQAHVMSQHPEEADDYKPYLCTECFRAFAQSSHLTRHLRTHTGEKPYKCEECTLAFASRWELNRHIRGAHLGERPHQCLECERAFHRNDELMDHYRRYHSDEKAYACPECDKKFSTRRDLKVHSRSHTGEKYHKCPECSKAFAEHSQLTAHLRVHTGEKPYKCKECPKVFSQLGDLKTHMRRHSGEKPYSCTYCNISFTTSKDLKVHVRTHTGEKPYQCKECSAAFTQAGKLNVHVRIHTGEKPFKCSYCDKRFSQNSHLKVHVRTHTGEAPFQCPLCNKTFKQSQQLKRHRLAVHPGEEDPVQK